MANVTRVNLTGKFAIAVEGAARDATQKEGKSVSCAEIVRRALTKAWGEDLENAPHFGRTVHARTADGASANRSTVQPVDGADLTADDLFSSGL
jgi:hypothetical protein